MLEVHSQHSSCLQLIDVSPSIQIWFPEADHNLNNTYSFMRLSTSLFLSKASFCLKLWDEKKAQYFILILPLSAKSFKD